MLYLVATPIGHLDDLSKRAKETLEKVDAILCEDTRKSRILLERYQIRKPLISYHKFKERRLLNKILDELEKGKELALISDAGTPCIFDPGQILVEGCIERGVQFTTIPGPCSPIQALLLSGFQTKRFQCIGFLPKKPQEALQRVLFYQGTTIAFESPERVLKTLTQLTKLAPERELALVREMTKAFEECLRGTATQLLHALSKGSCRGEMVLVISEGKPPSKEIPLETLISFLREELGLSLKEAIKLAAKLGGEPKSRVYRKVHGF